MRWAIEDVDAKQITFAPLAFAFSTSLCRGIDPAKTMWLIFFSQQMSRCAW